MSPHPLDPLLTPSSVAIIGASERPGSVGDLSYRQLRSGGFKGDVYAVNPGYQRIHGVDSYRSVTDLPAPPDMAVLAVANHLLEEQLTLAIDRGTRAVTIFASCHGESSMGDPLKDRLRDIANDAGVSICGGNGMGFLNVEDSVRVCGFYQPPLERGGVAFVSHSGSMFSAMLHNDRKLGFNMVVSSGLELNTTMGQYLDWVLDRESTRVVALFLETVRDPAAFTASLARADRMGVPVVALKVGTSPRGKAAVATHSEAMAGDETTYQALFGHYGVHVVMSPDEMLNTVEVFSSPRRATAAGLGAVHDSGGERALLIDTAHRVGVSLPDVAPETEARLAELLDPGLEAANPVDAWGTGRDAEGVFAGSLTALANDEAIGAVAFSVDLTAEERPDDAYSRSVLHTLAATGKPVMVVANLAAAVDPIQASILRSGGVPVLEGTETSLRAIAHLLDDWKRRSRAPQPDRLSIPHELPSHPITESAGLALLADYGIETVASRYAASVEEAVALGKELGYPLVIKTAHAVHKSDVGGVILNVIDEAGLRAVVGDMQSRLGRGVVVAQQVPAGVEISLGMYRDVQFGAVMLLGAGGLLVEHFDDHIALIPPVGVTIARNALDRLRIRSVLDGARGRGPAAIDRLVEAVVRFSELVSDHDEIMSIDINPLIVGPTSAVAVDALIERRP